MVPGKPLPAEAAGVHGVAVCFAAVEWLDME
uniref:Uncharacterized protein n=1 Tax=Arundo donax TaxID=35708 RepID=A0A0A9EFW6_ARUDO